MFVRSLFFIFSILSSSLLSCADDEAPKERVVTLDRTTAGILVNEQVILTPTFGDGESPLRTYTWSADNTNIVNVTSDQTTYAATITGKTAGVAIVTLASTDGEIQVACTVTVSVPETSVAIQQNIGLNVKEEIILTPEFDNAPVKSYTWASEPEGIVTLAVNEATLAVTVEGLREGTTTLTIVSDDGEISASAEVTVTYVADDVVKILTIGNSFSEDAVEHHLYGLAKATGKKIVIGNMYIGGAQLSLHQSNASTNNASYSYRKISLDGTRVVRGATSILTALEDEDWDYISFQQASDFSGKYETFTTPLPYLMNYTKEIATNPDVQYVLHQTWAYAQNSTHPAFPSYGSNQMTMYEAIVQTYIRAAELVDIDLVVPSGTGIQNGRTSFIGDNFNSDGYHLNTIGRYTASCTWYEKLFEESVINNTYAPAGYSQAQIEIAQQAAHEAVLNPNTVTPIEGR